MKKAIVVSFLLLTAGASVAAVDASRRSTLLSAGTVLNPFTLQVVSATRFVSPVTPTPVTPILPGEGDIRPITPIGDDGEDVRPGPFTPPPRSPYAPPPR